MTSLTSPPTWKPHPTLASMMALGADHTPFGSRATTRPVPTVPEKKKPPFTMVKNAIPLQPHSSSFGMVSPPAHESKRKQECARVNSSNTSDALGR